MIGVLREGSKGTPDRSAVVYASEVVAITDITDVPTRYSTGPVVSRDITGDPSSCVFRAGLP